MSSEKRDERVSVRLLLNQPLYEAQHLIGLEALEFDHVELRFRPSTSLGVTSSSPRHRPVREVTINRHLS